MCAVVSVTRCVTKRVDHNVGEQKIKGLTSGNFENLLNILSVRKLRVSNESVRQTK